MNPGFWAITLSTEIATDITVKKANDGDNKTIYVKASDSFQTGVDGNYLSVMNSALKDYISEVKPNSNEWMEESQQREAGLRQRA